MSQLILFPENDWKRRTDAADAAPLPWHARRDRCELIPAFEREDGSLLAEGIACREGVLEYLQPDGSIVREFVPAKTLEDSAGGLGFAPVTLEHPRVDVAPSNTRDLRVGTTGEVLRVEQGGFVKVHLVVDRQDAIDAVKGGKQDLSPGYVTRLDHTPGEHPVYGPYDAIQIERKYNHLAIVEQARGGLDVRMRLDAADPVPFSTTLIRRDVQTPEPTPQGGPMAINPGLLALCGRFGIHRRLDSDEEALAALNAKKDMEEKEDEEEKAKADMEQEKKDSDLAQLVKERDQAVKERDEAIRQTDEMLKADEEMEAKKDAAQLVPIAQGYGIDVANLQGGLPALKRAIVSRATGTEVRADASDASVAGALAVVLSRQDANGSGVDAGLRAWQEQPHAGNATPVRHDAYDDGGGFGGGLSSLSGSFADQAFAAGSKR